MGLKEDSRDIDGITIRTIQLPPLRAFPLMAKLGKILSPALGQLGDVSMDSDIKELAPALGELFSQLDERDAQSLIMEIFASSAAQLPEKLVPLNTVEMINTVFAGRFLTMLKAMKFVLEVNFADFFGEGLQPQPAQKPVKRLKVNR